MERLKNFRESLLSENLDGILVGSQANRRYLSGFTGSAGWVIITQAKALLAIDFRYIEQAKMQSSHMDTIHIKDNIASWLPSLVRESGIKRLGIESDHLSLSVYHSIVSSMQDSGDQVEVIPTKNIVESLRMIKNDDELMYIKMACDIADKAMSFARDFIRPGITEKQVAWELECFMRQQGSQTLPFEIIVASGPNAALPHITPTDRQILMGDPITIDLGARYNDYCSDMTRTFCLGKADDMFNKIYNVVLGTQMTALSILEPGMSASTADSIIRSMIEQAGYAEKFGHGLGHGIGIETHECPRLGTRSDDTIMENMAFTVEPGIYIPGWGGVRIEDTVIMKDGKLTSLTLSTKEPMLNGG